jgi:hypothetical protein
MPGILRAGATGRLERSGHAGADHGGASSIFERDVVRIGHQETRRRLRRDNDPARPVPEVAFADRHTLADEFRHGSYRG